MMEVMLQRNTMLEAKIIELKAKDPDRMIKISEVLPEEDTKLWKKLIKQIEKFEKSIINHMDHLKNVQNDVQTIHETEIILTFAILIVEIVEI